MEASHLLRRDYPATVGTAQCDRCYCRPARQGNITTPLICRLIPLSTEPQSLGTENMFRMYEHLQTLGLVGWSSGYMGSWHHFKTATYNVYCSKSVQSHLYFIVSIVCILNLQHLVYRSMIKLNTRHHEV